MVATGNEWQDEAMSDEPIRDQQPAAAQAGIWEHPCEQPGCKEWGGHGYSVAGRSPRWYCGEHMGAGERLIGRG